MSHRMGRVAHIIRDVVSDTISQKLSDPRVSRFTSVTRVELSADLRQADVYFSVMGTASEGEMTLRGLESARGLLQTRVAKRLDMRQCPILRLHLDLSLKKAAEILQLLDETASSPKPADENDTGRAANPSDSGDDE